MIKRHRTHRKMDLNLVVECIRDYTARHGQSPSLRDIGKATGGRSTSVVRYALEKLERDGRVRREHGAKQAIVIIDRESPD